VLCMLGYRRVLYQDLGSQSTFMGAEDEFVGPVPCCSSHFPSCVTSMATWRNSPLCSLSPSFAAKSRPDLSRYQMQVVEWSLDFVMLVEFTTCCREHSLPTFYVGS